MSLNLPTSLPPRLYLLAFNLEKGRMYRVPGLGRTLRAAALAQLHHDGLLADDRGLAVLAEASAQIASPADELSRLVLRQVTAEQAPGRTWAHWAGHDRATATRIVREELAAAGWVELGPRPDGLPRRGLTSVSVSPPDRQTVRVLNREASRALRGEIADAELPWDLAALVALAAAGGVITLVSARERRTWPERIAALTAMTGPPAKALAAHG
ncbi:GPP34 family phosphoprotein [Pseudofrankia saprophytica]|uniref:GPP34 family phosphoprotein n=1 Tax=Pseudofrankia saprophytica TaxID=298655 RepID=UPI000234BCE2|nr:GPP34 family phosphoprotein [Pseudofrankia saprophytica]